MWPHFRGWTQNSVEVIVCCELEVLASTLDLQGTEPEKRVAWGLRGSRGQGADSKGRGKMSAGGLDFFVETLHHPSGLT